MQDLAWYKRLLRWVKGFFRAQKATRPKPRIEAEWHTWHGILYRLSRTTPEAIDHATYRFIPAYKAGHFLLTCDRYIRTRNPRGDGSSASFSGIRNGSPAYGHPDPSHRLSLTQVKTSGNVVKVRILFSYPVDFVGANAYGKIWQAKNNKVVTQELLARIDDFTDRNAILITADLASLLTADYEENIEWEREIHERAEPLGVSHAILLRTSQRVFPD